MKLSDYMKREGLTGIDFARRTGLSKGMVSLLMRGHVWLSRNTAKKISAATGGEVTADDFVAGKSAK